MMEVATRTYSTRKPIEKHLKKKDSVHDVIFGERKEDVFEDLPSNSHPLQQPRSKRRIKKAVKKNKDVSKENSFCLFQDEDIRKKRRNTQKRRMPGVVEKKSGVKRFVKDDYTLSSSDSNKLDNLFIEKTVEPEKKFPKVSNCPLKQKFSCDLEHDNSIEISRNTKVSPVYSLPKLACSPPIKIVSSDVDSDSSFQISNKDSNTDDLQFSSTETGWATVSSGPFDTTGSRHRQPASSYTYTMCSTYSEDSATSSMFTKAITTSPPVKMKKFPLKLNSTTNKNKDDIGVVQFPDSISAISINKELKSCLKGGHQVASRKPEKQPKEIERNMLRHPPKCSTKLFTSDTGTSFISTFERLGQSTIHKGSKSNGKESSPTRDGIVADSLQQKQKLVEPKRCLIKTSTPQINVIPLSFNMSPIDSRKFDDDETGMPSTLSVEANTDDISDDIEQFKPDELDLHHSGAKKRGHVFMKCTKICFINTYCRLARKIVCKQSDTAV